MVSIGELTWKKVVTSDNVTIGRLEGGEINQNNWQVTHVHVGLNDKTIGEFGLKRPFLGRVVVCLPIDYVNSIGEEIVLKKTMQELKETKECQEFASR